MGEETISHAEFQVIYLATLPKEVEHNTLLLKCGLHLVTSFWKVQSGKAVEGWLCIEKPDKHYLN